MKNRLRAIVRNLAAIVCIFLFFIGVLIGVVLGFLGIAVLISALYESLMAVAAVALWGLTTVVLASICCGSGLLFLWDRCVSTEPAENVEQNKRFLCLALASIAITVVLFVSMQWRCFKDVCLAADGLYVLLIILYRLIKRGKTHDPDRS